MCLESNLDSVTMFDEGHNAHHNGSFIFGPQFMASNLYQLSPLEDLTLALSLVRPTRIYGDEELLREETRVTRDKYGTVTKVYVVCEQDKVLKPNFQVSMIERNPTNDVKVIPDADHMPMFSKPHELFSHLQEIANTYY
ncbi:putative carboxylesterase [Lupinus albus]|uniref:Putative carboxylesterase n=1 Tax=Lupinus albus TaxID=3870 RepID=A0A6A4PC33_LUPAL|nr:putative carboxylesterase [Lupinus albus]KAE9596653.1 putative carboxylesterase [Lupinus albus]